MFKKSCGLNTCVHLENPLQGIKWNMRLKEMLLLLVMEYAWQRTFSLERLLFINWA